MADTLKVVRTRAGKTQEELAKAVKVSTFTVSSWENGNSEPRLSQAKAICNFLSCTLDDIIFLRTGTN